MPSAKEGGETFGIKTDNKRAYFRKNKFDFGEMSGIGLKRGAFIVFEGVDRSGKSTQCRKLVEKLKKEGISSELIHFPDRSTSIGKIISDYLTNKKDYPDQAIHLLFAANRWENEKRMKELLHQGVTIIADRYCFSGVAYSSAKPGMSVNWCQQPESGLPKPDLVFYLNVLLNSASERAGFGEERYEKEDFQKKVNENCMKLKDNTWKVIDGNRSIEEVHEEIFREAMVVIKDAEGRELKTLW